MTESRNPLRAVAWAEIFPWLKLAKCPRFALSAGMIVIAMIGLLATHVGISVIGMIFSNVGDNGLSQSIREQAIGPWTWAKVPVIDPPGDIGRLSEFLFLPLTYAQHLMKPFVTLFSWNVSFYHFVYSLLCAAWEIVVWSICGAAITRSAALFLTREEKISPVAAIKFGFRRWTSYVGGPVLPVVCAMLIAIPLAIMGLIAKSNFGASLVAVGWPIVIVLGFLLAMLLIGLMFGWVLMWPTISVEGTESFDAMSRAYSYTYHRAGRYLFYAGFALFCGVLAIFAVQLFAYMLMYLGQWGLSWGATEERMLELNRVSRPDDPSLLRFPRWIIALSTDLIHLAVMGYVASYFWTAATAIYLLLRKDEDGAEVEEIFIEPEGDSFGLPTLKKDAAGVPLVDNDSTLPRSGA